MNTLRYALTLFALLLVVPFCAAEMTFVDASTGREIVSGVVSVTTPTSFNEYLLLPTERLSLPVLQEQSRIDIRSNFSSDIMFTGSIAANASPKTVIVHPAGVMLLQVKDDVDNYVVHGVVTISCPAFQASEQTDRTGTLRTVLPADTCMVAASARDKTNSVRLTIVQGQTLETTLVLNATSIDAKETQSVSGTFFVVLAIIGIFLLLVFFVTRRTPKKYVATGAKDTLLSKEQMIVNALLARGGKGTLTELRSSVRLPRTSLLRTVEGLERRGVLVKKTMHGKVIIELLKK